MERSPLLDLTQELLDFVVSDIRRPRDLVAVCLTCKTLQHGVMPRLYRHVELQFEKASMKAIRALLRVAHPGHKYIRSLAFTYGELVQSDPSGCRLLVRRMLQVLPRDSLHAVLITDHLSFDEETLLMLLTQQRVLRTLDIGALNFHESEKDHCDAMAASYLASGHLTTLRIPPAVGASLAERIIFTDLLRVSSNVETLAIESCSGHGSGALYSDSYAWYLWHALNTRSTALKVKRLRLFHQAFGGFQSPGANGTVFASQNPDRSLIESLPFRHLTSLVVSNCTHVREFLRALTEDFHGNVSCLKRFSLDLVDGTIETDGLCPTLKSVEEFLRSFTGLQTLAVKAPFVGADVEFDVKCLKNHYKSLRHFYFAIGAAEGWNKQWSMPVNDQIELFTSIDRMEQLSFVMPGTILDPHRIDDQFGFYRVLAALAKQPHLKVLRMLSWPWCQSDTLLHQMSDYRRQDLDIWASKVMNYFRSKRESGSKALHLLSFGDWTTKSPNMSHFDRAVAIHGEICFVPGTQRTVFGHEEPVAIPIDSRDVRWMIPDLEDFELAKVADEHRMRIPSSIVA